jgi:hypothetical protein
MSVDRRIAHIDMDAFFASVVPIPELCAGGHGGGGPAESCPQDEGRRHTGVSRLRDYVDVASTATYGLDARALGHGP